MPSKKKHASRSTGSDEDDDYRKKRERNNLAVKRSRVKSKQRTQETQSRVRDLKVRNQVMEERIKNLEKDLKFLKDLFLAQAQTKSEYLTNVDLKNLLKSDDDDDDNNGKSRTRQSTSKT